jgi:hypothetical protein
MRFFDKRRFYLGFLLLFLIIAPILAQETTEEPIIPSNTPLPSPTFTELPTITPLPSETPTDLPTETETSSATYTSTASATATNTATATPAFWDIPLSSGVTSCYRGEICATVSVQKGTSHGTYVETMREDNDEDIGILQVTVRFDHFISNIAYDMDIFAPYPPIGFFERGGQYDWFNQGTRSGGGIWDYPRTWGGLGGGNQSASSDTLVVVVTHDDHGDPNEYARWQLFRVKSYTLGAAIPTATPTITSTLTPSTTYTATPTATSTPYPSPTDTYMVIPVLRQNLEQAIVFSNSADGDDEIYLAYGSVVAALTNNSYDDVFPSYSEDGQRIAFQSFRNGAWGVYTINSDGTNEQAVALNNAIEPDWYADNNSLVFARGSGIYKAQANGTGESLLALHGSGQAKNPAISHNGEWIIYQLDNSLYIMDGACTASCSPSLLLSGGNYDFPAWSYNDSHLAFSLSNDIYVASVDYSGSIPQLNNIVPIEAANSAQLDTHPVWSREGDALFFESDRDGTSSLYKYALGTSLQIIAHGRGGDIQQEQTGEPTATPAQTATPALLNGLHGEYYEGFQVLDDEVAIRRDEVLNFTSASWNLVASGKDYSNRFSVRWTGILIPQAATSAETVTPIPTTTATPTLTPTPATIDLHLQFAGLTANTDGIRVWLWQGETAPTSFTYNTWGQSAPEPFSVPVFPNQPYYLWIEYYHYGSGAPNLTLQYRYENTNWDTLPKEWLLPINPNNAAEYNNSYGAISLSPTETRSFAAMASCHNNTVTLVPVFPGRSNETQDMLAIADGSGLYIHDGPTWNAMRRTNFDNVVPTDASDLETNEIAAYSWDGLQVSINGWLELEYNPATDMGNNEVWYRVNNTRTVNDLWINGRLPDPDNDAVNPNEQFYFIVGMSQDKIPCRDRLTASMGEIPTNEPITFTYDRNAAAQYAIEHSYRIIPNNNPNPLTRRTTLRLSNIAIPFAFFDYDELLGGATRTGSAIFVSESIWMGGLPMTQGFIECNSNTNEEGWRYCPPFASLMWDAHQGLIAHFIIGPSGNIVPSGDLANVPSSFIDSTLNAESRGSVIPNPMVQGQDVSPSWELNSFSTGGIDFPFVYLSAGTVNLNEDVRLNIWAEFNLESLNAGDYMYIDSFGAGGGGSTDAHGLMIVGWGEIKNCEAVMSDANSLINNSYIEDSKLEFNVDIFASRQEAARNFDYVVPYVADYNRFAAPINSGIPEYNAGLTPVPRPFYCTRYRGLPDPEHEGV